MSKNRDYTGLERTPSSMAWLIRQRSVVQGRIDQIMRQLESLPRELVRLRGEIASLDAVIPLHEVKVDPSAIKGIRPCKPRIAPHGAITRHILGQLREACGASLTTLELTVSFAKAQNIELGHAQTRKELTTSIRKRCQRLCNAGLLQRHHRLVTTEYGAWSLIDDQEEEIEKKVA